MTTEELRIKSLEILREVKHEILRTNHLQPLFRSYIRGGGHKDMKLPRGTEQIMNDGGKKEILFDYLRQATAGSVGGTREIEAWIFVADQYRGSATEEGLKHKDEWTEYQDTGFKTLERMGWAIVEEMINVVAQTEQDVVMTQQVYVREPKLEYVGPPLVQYMPQSEFHGRMKMWNATADDITGMDPSRRGAEKIGLALMDELVDP